MRGKKKKRESHGSVKGKGNRRVCDKRPILFRANVN